MAMTSWRVPSSFGVLALGVLPWLVQSVGAGPDSEACDKPLEYAHDPPCWFPTTWTAVEVLSFALLLQLAGCLDFGLDAPAFSAPKALPDAFGGVLFTGGAGRCSDTRDEANLV